VSNSQAQPEAKKTTHLGDTTDSKQSSKTLSATSEPKLVHAQLRITEIPQRITVDDQLD
jgi:hypothetical protein